MTKSNKESESIDVQAGELGRLLQEYRESVGYSVTQTADALCLSEAIVSKLEKEEFDTLAEPPYIRGYLRNYAKLAEKDPSVLIETYENLRGASPEELTRHYQPIKVSNKRKPSLLPVLAKLALAAVIIAGLVSVAKIPQVKNWFVNTWHSFSQQRGTRMNGNIDNINNPILTGNMPAPLPIPSEENSTEVSAPLQAGNSGEAKPQDSAQTDTNKTEENKTTETSPDTSDQVQTTTTSINTDNTEKNTESRVITSSQADETPVGNSVKIKLVFNEEVWLRIKDKDKKTVYEAQTAAGNEKELELEKPLTFRVGNAQGISIFVDGKTKDITEYTKGSVANFTLQ